MTNMESTLGWKQVISCSHASELLPITLSGRQHVKLLMHYPKLWFSYMAVGRLQRGVPLDGFQGIGRQKMGTSVYVVESSLRQETLITLPTRFEDSSFKMAVEIAYKSPPVVPFLGTYMESTFSKPHPSKRRLFPANETSVSNGDSDALVAANPSLPSGSGDSGVDYNGGPSVAVIMYLECLELTGSHLGKCLKHASSVVEEDLINLLKILSSYGYQRSDIKTMFSKYPSLVKVRGIQAIQCFQYFSGLGLSKNIITSLLLKRPALIACNLKRAGQVIDYLLSIGTSKEDLIVMIACRPHVLEHDVEVVKSLVKALMNASLDQSDINKLIKRAPAVFTGSLQDIKRSLLFWSKVGVEGKALCRAILRRPNLLNYNTESMLNTYKYLQQWFEHRDLTKLVSRFAELLSYDPQAKLKPLIDYFLELGLSEKEVARVIRRRPQLMSCTLERLKKVADFLIGLGLKDHMVGKVLIASPQVFTLNAEVKLKQGVEFFRSVGLDKERDLEFVFARSAQLFCCSIEKNLLPTFEFFSNIGLEKESLSTMIATFPSMMGQSVELSLAPKYNFLIGEMKRTNQELVQFPQYFGYSLEGRIKPRHELLAERGLVKSLPSMLACTDDDFCKRYVEPYSPLQKLMTVFNNRDATQQPEPKKNKLKKTKVLFPPLEVQSEPTQHDRSPTSPEQQALSMNDFPEFFMTEHPISNDWNFPDSFPQVHEQQQLYSASFRKFYKKPTPCGIWIHAYKFDM